MRKLLLTLIAMLLCVVAMAQEVVPTKPKGRGTEDSPYLLYNLEELMWFANEIEEGNTSSCANLEADIDLSPVCYPFHDGKPGKNWVPIGTNRIFKGTFYGKGHKITNLYIEAVVGNRSDNGFFGKVSKASIHNLIVSGHLELSTRMSNNGMVVGNAQNSEITSCYAHGHISGGSNTGGIVGQALDTKISECSNFANVTLDDGNKGLNVEKDIECYGGIVGYSSGLAEIITRCSNYGDVSVNCSDIQASKVGGIAGYLGIVDNYGRFCANFVDIVTVRGTKYVGGIIGYFNPNDFNHITYSFSNARVVVLGSDIKRNGLVVGHEVHRAGERWEINHEDTYKNLYCGTYAQLVHKDKEVEVADDRYTRVSEEDNASGKFTYEFDNLDDRGKAGWYRTHWIGQNLSDSQTRPTPRGHQVQLCHHQNCLGHTLGPDTYVNSVTEVTSIDGHAGRVNGICTYCGVGEDWTQPAEGDGSEDSPYLISTAGELLWYCKEVNGEFSSTPGDFNGNICARLMADIDLSSVCHPAKSYAEEVSWTPIGGKSRGAYEGTFDGNGHKITGLYINTEKLDDSYTDIGLFGKITLDGKVMDLEVQGTIIAPNASCVGMLTGIQYGLVENCVVRGTIYAGRVTGGIGGSFETMGSINRCASYVNIISDAQHTAESVQCAGGIAGEVLCGASISDCAYYGNITMTAANAYQGVASVGGIVGSINPRGNGYFLLNRCYVDKGVNITTLCHAGGIVGYAKEAIIESGFTAASVNVTNAEKVGGLITGNGDETTNAYRIVYYDASATLTIGGNEITENRAFGTNGTPRTDRYYAASAEEITSGHVTYEMQPKDWTKRFWVQDLSNSNSVPTLNLQFDMNAYSVALRTLKGCDGSVVYEYFNGEADEETNHVAPHPMDYNTGLCRRCGFPVAQPEGTGTKADPYRIGNVAQLYNYAQNVNNATATTDAILKSYAMLTADIDFEPLSINWQPMGTEDFPYAGNFDGNGYKITGFTVRNANGGLFNRLHGATVKNVDITVDIQNDASGTNRSAIIAYVADASTISGCTTRGSIQGPIVGGVVWQSQGKSSIIDCTNYATVTGKSYVGGIATAALDGKIERCVNMGNVTGSLGLDDISASYVGGIVARLRTSSEGALDITDCISYGTLSARTACGGIVGRSQSTSSVNITRCVAMGDVYQLPGEGGTYGQPAAFGRFYGETYTGATAPVVSLGYFYKASQLVLRGSNQAAADTEKGASAITSSEFTRTVSTLNSEQCGHWMTEDRLKVGSTTLRNAPMVKATVFHNFPDETGLCYCGEGIHKDDEGYYLIATAKQLAAFRDLVNSATAESGAINARQTADIDMYEVCHPAITKPKTPKLSWEPIGNGNWWGTYDGQGHKLTNLYYSDADNHGGLFGQIGTPYNIVRCTYTRICNLSVEGNVSVSANTTEGAQGAAILCAVNYGGTIENCQTAGRVYSVAPNVGGFVGYSKGVLSCCRNTAVVEGNEANVGGLVGQLDSYMGTNGVEYCANTEGVSGSYAVGGLVGKVGGMSRIYSSYNTANATTASASKSTVQPIVGIAPNGYTTEDCYYDTAMMSDGQQELYEANGVLTTAFTNGRVAFLLGEPWGQNIGADATAKEAVPYLMSYPVYEDGTKLTNFYPSIYGLTKLIDLSLRGGRISLQGIEAQRQHILTR